MSKIRIELQSLVEIQDSPFLVVDRDFKIIAVNRAFELAYEARREDVVGRRCYEVSHRNARPCFELGEDCPLEQMKGSEPPAPCSCLHVHYDDQGRTHYVRLKAYPLAGPNGRLYMGEAIQDLSVQGAHGGRGVCMAGRSQVFLEALAQLHDAAESEAPVLIVGETGTGKELAASFIHEKSSRNEGPFFPVDCAALNETLFESEVFGHERGAFTGSIEKRRGLFELAHGGTLFLDEIGELSLASQAKLLRVLESGEFRRVGGGRILHADVRTICATNRDVAASVRQGEFRADLYYRIACMSVRLPALRERMEDIPMVADTILEDIGRSSPQRYTLTEDALALLQEHDYPGNVRELRNILSAAAAHAKGPRIDGALIARALNAGPCAPDPESRAEQLTQSNPAPESATLHDLEARHIATLLRRHDGNRRRVAASLGVSERTLYRKLNRYNLR